MFFRNEPCTIIQVFYVKLIRFGGDMYNIAFINKVLEKRKLFSIRELAARYEISPQTIHKWGKGLIPKQTRNRRNTKLDINALIEDVRLYPQSYQCERARRLGVSDTCIFNNLKKLGVVYKSDKKVSNDNRKIAVLTNKQYLG
ncbi:MAG: transposase [Proteobacteria bacterium]|nr:MAG: transposase [Pseudomonadota bacterium]